MSDKKSKKKKGSASDFVLSGPTNFQSGMHVEKKDLGEKMGIQNLSHYASNSSTVPSSLQVKEGDARIFEQKFEENESKRRERELVMKNELGAIKLAITGPKNVKHKLHVDNQLNWTGDDSLSRSIELSTKLGEGAYGSVFKAIHVPTSNVLAVKTIPISADSEQGENIQDEIDILRQCRHDNIVSLYGCMVAQSGDLWILMDFCGAGSIKDFQKKFTRKLDEAEFVSLLYYVVKGLEYLHSTSIIHRDLKCANILLTESGDVKIADFGVSFHVSQGDKANMMVGTPLFMSPEALEATEICDSSSDIWSLGITAIEMVDEYPPYYEEHVMRAMLLITQGEPPTLKNPSSKSPEFNAFLARCLKKNAKERPTAAQLLDDPLFVGRNHKGPILAMMAEYKLSGLQENGSQDLSADVKTSSTNSDISLSSSSSSSLSKPPSNGSKMSAKGKGPDSDTSTVAKASPPASPPTSPLRAESHDHSLASNGTSSQEKDASNVPSPGASKSIFRRAFAGASNNNNNGSNNTGTSAFTNLLSGITPRGSQKKKVSPTADKPGTAKPSSPSLVTLDKAFWEEATIKKAEHTMQELLTKLEEQLIVEKIFSSDADYYSSISFSQLISDIEFLTEKEEKLLKKLEKHSAPKQLTS